MPLVFSIVYQNDAATVSAVARRRRAEAIAARKAAEAKICPGAMSACFTSDPSASEVSFECLDTQSELESCGGCVNGHYTIDYTPGTPITSLGVDCTALEGVAFGAIACIRGHCVASPCRLGYRLVGRECRKSSDTSLNVQGGERKPRSITASRIWKPRLQQPNEQ